MSHTVWLALSFGAKVYMHQETPATVYTMRNPEATRTQWTYFTSAPAQSSVYLGLGDQHVAPGIITPRDKAFSSNVGLQFTLEVFRSQHTTVLNNCLVDEFSKCWVLTGALTPLKEANVESHNTLSRQRGQETQLGSKLSENYC